MARIIANVIGTGNRDKDKDDPIRVNLPNYKMIGDILPGNKVEIEIPDEDYDIKSKKLNINKIRQKYKGQVWDNDNIIDSV